MLRGWYLFIAVILLCNVAAAETIELPNPKTKGTISVEEAIQKRNAEREKNKTKPKDHSFDTLESLITNKLHFEKKNNVYSDEYDTNITTINNFLSEISEYERKNLINIGDQKYNECVNIYSNGYLFI